MERYEQIAVVGEGSYGLVMKCRHRESDQIVAVKKFLETEEDAAVRKMALREIRMLKKLKHENLVTMIEVFRYRKRFYLVFEYLAGTVLDELEKHSGGIGEEKCRERIFQVLRAIAFCHSNHIVHRDVKPENVLISSMGVVKLCDFGFARVITPNAEPCTEYVATRWYRAPELLVGEQQYGAAVDVWAIGCLFAEMLTGDPLFPGESDIDQLYLICKAVGKPCTRHQDIMLKNSQLRGMVLGSSTIAFGGLQKAFGNWSLLCVDFLENCLKMDPHTRPTSDDLLRHNYFTHDKFPQRFLPALREKVNAEFNSNPLLRKYKAEILMSTDKTKIQLEKSVTRRSSHVEPLRWKLNLIEGGSIKRKLSCDHHHSDFVLQGRKSYREKTGLTFLKSNKLLNAVNESDVQSLGKCMENMTARSDVGQETTMTTTSNAKTTESFNFNCNAKAIKKSPTLLQSIHPSAIKNVLSQTLAAAVPNAVKGLFHLNSKKLERQSVQDQFLNIEPVHLGSNLLSNSTGKRKEKLKDDFSLPNLPGATTSPKGSKGGNKATASPATSNIITPRILSATSSPKHILPLM